jgi:hypothetical protein
MRGLPGVDRAEIGRELREDGIPALEQRAAEEVERLQPARGDDDVPGREKRRASSARSSGRPATGP